MRKRPELKVGDVCRISKRPGNPFRKFKNNILVVNGINHNSSSGYTIVECMVLWKSSQGCAGNRTEVHNIKRKWLWKTGYNVYDPKPYKPASWYQPYAGPRGSPAIEHKSPPTRWYDCGRRYYGTEDTNASLGFERINAVENKPSIPKCVCVINTVYDPCTCGAMEAERAIKKYI